MEPMIAPVSSSVERLLSSAQVIGYGSVAAGGRKNLNDRFNWIWRSASAVAGLTGCSKPKAVTEFSWSADGNRPKAEVAGTENRTFKT